MVIMGRLPKNKIHKSLHSNATILKTKHRHADTKYRTNVQYLYSKLKEMSQNKAAKDSILSVTLFHIQALENEIIEKVGSEEMKNYQNDFKNFLLHEEALWKIKDTVKWWSKVEETLNSHDFIDSKETDFAVSSRSKSLNLQQKNVTSNTEYSQASSCCNTRMTACIPTSQTFDGLSARSTKSKNEVLEHEFNISENTNIIPHVSEFSENIFTPYDEEPDSFLSFEEQNYFSNENSADPEQFETYLF